ncbi:hypothetical protein HDU67_002227, partial [Dinochytrium kinnereticum]
MKLMAVLRLARQLNYKITHPRKGLKAPLVRKAQNLCHHNQDGAVFWVCLFMQQTHLFTAKKFYPMEVRALKTGMRTWPTLVAHAGKQRIRNHIATRAAFKMRELPRRSSKITVPHGRLRTTRPPQFKAVLPFGIQINNLKRAQHRQTVHGVGFTIKVDSMEVDKEPELMEVDHGSCIVTSSNVEVGIEAKTDLMDLSWANKIKLSLEKKVPYATIIAERRARRRNSIKQGGHRQIKDWAPARINFKQKMTAKDARIKRCQEFFKRNKRDHDHVVATNRGFNFEGLPDCYNLGNCLNITQKLVEDLNKDPDQSVQPLRGVPIPLKDPSRSIILQGIYDGESAIEPNNPGRDDLIEAENLVKEQFAEKNVVADLSGVVEDEFSLEYAKD